MKKHFLFLSLLFLFSCDNTSQEKSYQTTIIAFGTKITVTLDDVPTDKAIALSKNIEQKFNHMNQQWHAWQPSTLTAINSVCKNGQTYTADADVIELLKKGTYFYTLSDGLFNPAAGELIALWGFLSNTPTKKRTAPSQAAIDNWLVQAPSMNDIVINNNKVACKNPHVRLDFGGFAKGYGVGQIINYLQQQGVQHAMVNAGGDLLVIGDRHSRPWRVALQNPFAIDEPLAYLDVHDKEAVFSSGTYFRKFSDGQKTYHHILDPRTGYPSQGFIATTVIHTDPTLADAAATSLLIAGKKDWQHIAKKMGITRVLLIDDQGKIYITPEMVKQVSWVNEPERIIISDLSANG